MSNNRLHVYLFGKDKYGTSQKFYSVFNETERANAIHTLVEQKPNYAFGFVVTDKQRNSREIFNDLYQEAKAKGGATLFIEPTTVKQLLSCNVSLSYYQHTTNKK